MHETAVVRGQEHRRLRAKLRAFVDGVVEVFAPYNHRHGAGWGGKLVA